MASKPLTRRTFLAQGTAAAAAVYGARVAMADPQNAAAGAAPPSERKPSMKIGFHTDAFNSAFFNFEKCLEWAQQNDVHYIECGVMDGVSWAHGLGYWPHLALYEDPVLLRRKMEKLRGPVLADRRRLSAVRQGRPPARRALRDEVDRLGGPGRQPPRRHDRRSARARRTDRRGGHGPDEAELRADHRGGRGAQDRGEHRAARLLHHQARVHRPDAEVLRHRPICG